MASVRAVCKTPFIDSCTRETCVNQLTEELTTSHRSSGRTSSGREVVPITPRVNPSGFQSVRRLCSARDVVLCGNGKSFVASTTFFRKGSSVSSQNEEKWIQISVKVYEKSTIWCFAKTHDQSYSGLVGSALNDFVSHLSLNLSAIYLAQSENDVSDCVSTALQAASNTLLEGSKVAKPFCSLAGGIILKASSSKYLVVGGSSGGLHLFLRSHETGKVSHLKDGELGRLPVLRFNSKNFFVNSCDQGDSLLVFDDAVFTQISKTASDGVDQLLSHQWTADLSSIVEYVEDVWHKGQKDSSCGFLACEVGSHGVPIPTLNRFQNLRNAGLIPWNWSVIFPKHLKGGALALVEFLQMFLPKEVEVDALKGLVRSNKFSTLHLNLRVPDVSFQTNGKNLLIDVRVNHGIKTSLELWTGVISHISLQEGLQKRSLARSILVTLARMGKRYDAVKDVMKGLDEFVPNDDTVAVTGIQHRFCFSDLGTVFKVLSGDMIFELSEFDVEGSSSLGKYQRINLRGCNYSFLARCRAEYLERFPTHWEMSFPQFLNEIISKRNI